MGEHPFRRAWETRDVDAWAAALADDVVVHSPVITSPFAGRAAVRELYEVLFAAFGRVDIFAELTGGDARMFSWRGEMGGRLVAGEDRRPGGGGGGLRPRRGARQDRRDPLFHPPAGRQRRLRGGGRPAARAP